MAKMTKQHYEAIADILRTVPLQPEDRRRLALHSASVMADDNPAFDVNRFVAACEAGKGL